MVPPEPPGVGVLLRVACVFKVENVESLSISPVPEANANDE